MKDPNSKTPPKILDYLKENFEPGFLFEILGTSSLDGHQVYNIEVLMDNIIIKLRINETGKVIKIDSQDVFPTDSSDAGESPE